MRVGERCKNFGVIRKIFNVRRVGLLGSGVVANGATMSLEETQSIICCGKPPFSDRGDTEVGFP